MIEDFESDDQHLNHLLALADQPVSVERIHRVRHAVLRAMEARPRWSIFSLFRFEPAFLMATALLGLALGASMPTVTDADSSAAYIYFQPQSIFEGVG